MFGGISAAKEDSSDSDEKDNSDATPVKEQAPPVQQNVMDLIDLGGSSQPAATQPTATQQPVDLLGDIFGGPSQPSPAPVAAPQGPTYRPHPITTPEFGASWGTLPMEKSVTVAMTGITSTDAYKQTAASRLSFHVVEVINNEVICAGMDPSNMLCLLHCRVDPTGNLTFTVKTSQQSTLNDLETRLLPSLAGGASAPQ